MVEEPTKLFDYAKQQQFANIQHSFYQTTETAHGRIETRRHWSLGEVQALIGSERWQGLASIGMVEAQRRINGQVTLETRYYISSLPPDAKRMANAVRSHWGIENSLHWVLDVAFDEDRCRIRKDHAPQNFALLRQVALNLLSYEQTAKGGIKAKRKKAGWNNGYLAKVLAQ